MKKVFKFFVLFMSVIMLTACVEIKTKDEYYKTEEIKSNKKIMMSIDCSDILYNMESLDEGLEEYIPEFGLILPDTYFPIKDGDTAYDVLVRAVKQNKIQLETQGLFGKKEIEGINYIYNSSCGDSSRWIYKINGEIQQPVCNISKLSAGDIVQWVFVCEEEE